MSYEVFTLKYRPKSFDDVVGQRHVADTLKRAVVSERVANAYLFCGSRGVGKTSMARILARALNCPHTHDGEPCNVCDVCRTIARGEDIDVIEIDGASNRGIDDVRNIRDGAGYVPSRSPFKVYIIDEVHMLTIQAFNALLKVLEEPPPHVRFVFATTDPNALPDTILSRCQRHEFRRISVDDIVGRLVDIASREGVTVGDDVLRAIAAKAEGGLRDSISILDQVISFAGDSIGMADLEQAVGMLPREHLARLLDGIARGDAAGTLTSLHASFDAGFDPQELLSATIRTLRDVMVHQVDAGPGPHDEVVAGLADALNPDRVQYLLRLFLNVRGEIKRAGHERVQLELTCLKAVRSADLLPVEEVLARLKGEAGERPARPAPAAPIVQAPASAPRTVEAAPAPRAPAPPAASGVEGSAVEAAPPAGNRVEAAPAPASAPRTVEAAPAPRADEAPPVAPARPSANLGLEDTKKRWQDVVQAVRGRSAIAASAVEACKLRDIRGGEIVLATPHGNAFVANQLKAKDTRRAVEDAVESVLGARLGLAVVEESAAAGATAEKKNVYEDPSVRKFIEHFDGGITDVEREDG